MTVAKPHPKLQIKDLDTGRTFRIDEVDQLPTSRRLTGDMKSLSHCVLPIHPLEAAVPKGETLSYFVKYKREPFYRNVTIHQVLEVDYGIRCVEFSDDGSFLGVGCESGEIGIFSYHENLVGVRTYQAHKDDVTSLVFKSENLLFSSSMDGCVKLWHPSERKALASFEHDDAVIAVAVHPTDASVFLACTFGNKVVVWNVKQQVVIKTIDFVSPPTAAAFSPEGTMFAIGCYNGTCFLYQFEDFRYTTQFIAGPRAKRKTTHKKITSIVFRNEQQFFVATNDSRLRLYTTENYSVIRKFIGHETKEKMLKMSFSNENDIIMCGSERNGSVVIWPIDHEPYYKGTFGFTRERSKTCEGFSFGPKTKITGTVFSKDTTKAKLVAVITDASGHIYLVKGQSAHC